MPFDPSTGPFQFDPAPGERLVHLTKGFTALIDADDWGRVSAYSWHVHFARSNVYARSRCKTNGTPLYLHRMVIDAAAGMLVDHQNRVSLDCRRQNLRIVGFDKNAQNAEYHNATGYRGVSAARNKFRARMRHGGQIMELGYHATAEEAARAYDAAALSVFGPYAWTNFPQVLPAAPVMADIPF